MGSRKALLTWRKMGGQRSNCYEQVFRWIQCPSAWYLRRNDCGLFLTRHFRWTLFLVRLLSGIGFCLKVVQFRRRMGFSETVIWIHVWCRLHVLLGVFWRHLWLDLPRSERIWRQVVRSPVVVGCRKKKLNNSRVIGWSGRFCFWTAFRIPSLQFWGDTEDSLLK